MGASMEFCFWFLEVKSSRPQMADRPAGGRAGGVAPQAKALVDLVSGWLALPFEFLRAQHAAAVQAGWLPRSAIESARFGQALERAEHLALGPLARRR